MRNGDRYIYLVRIAGYIPLVANFKFIQAQN